MSRPGTSRVVMNCVEGKRGGRGRGEREREGEGERNISHHTGRIV